jgi:hypothetical protein
MNVGCIKQWWPTHGLQAMDREPLTYNTRTYQLVISTLILLTQILSTVHEVGKKNRRKHFKKYFRKNIMIR